MVCVHETSDKLYEGGPLNWAKDFLRDPSDFPYNVDSKYLSNQKSAAQFFLRWFTKDSSTSYEVMLRSAHRIAACGPKGGCYYWIPTAGGQCLVPHPRSTDQHIIYESPVPGWVRETYPGAMRSDLEENGIEHPTEDVVFLTDQHLTTLASARARSIAVLPVEYLAMSDDAAGVHNGLFHIGLMGCDICLPVVRHSKHQFSRRAPVGECKARLLQICSQQIQECRALFMSNKLRELIRHLIAYYHTALNLMPFANINNSLLMGQINAVMRLAAFPCVPHASLDSFALVCSYDSFAEVVRACNPSLDFSDTICTSSEAKY